MPDTLFSQLAFRFATSPENLATEALRFVFDRSRSARRCFVRLLAQTGVELEDDYQFVTQAHGPDGAIPDLVGRTADGRQAILCEAKFWAGLTDAQPVSYLRRLAPEQSGILLFIVPAKRTQRLWGELDRRCRDAKVEFDALSGATDNFCWSRAASGHVLALVSWSHLLDVLERELDAHGHTMIAADVRQLRGLCERMDSEAFLPLRNEELTGELGRRVVQFCDLVDLATDRLIEKGLASKQGLRASGSRASYGQYVRLGKIGAQLQFNAVAWTQWESTPIWLAIFDADWKRSDHVLRALSAYERETPRRLFANDRAVYVPIFLLPRAEREDVVASMLDQVRKIVSDLEATGFDAAGPAMPIELTEGPDDELLDVGAR
jgi:hypothetical protein